MLFLNYLFLIRHMEKENKKNNSSISNLNPISVTEPKIHIEKPNFPLDPRIKVLEMPPTIIANGFLLTNNPYINVPKIELSTTLSIGKMQLNNFDKDSFQKDKTEPNIHNNLVANKTNRDNLENKSRKFLPQNK